MALTHNVFDYGDSRDFRRETMAGMIEAFSELAVSQEIRLVPSTIGGVAEACRGARAATKPAALEGKPS